MFNLVIRNSSLPNFFPSTHSCLLLQTLDFGSIVQQPEFPHHRVLPGTQCWCVQRSRPGREYASPERSGDAAMLLPNWCKVRLLRRLRHATKEPLLSPVANIQVMSNHPYLFSAAVICKRTIILTCIHFSNYLAYLRWSVHNSKFSNIGFIQRKWQ
jgi:hypothetical protein